MSNSVEQSFVLDSIVVILSLLKLGDGLHASHGPVRQFPRLRPANIHVLRVQDHNYQFELFVPNARTQTRSCVWRYSRFYSVDASLSQHQVRVEPLVVPPVSVRVLLYIVELCTNNVTELFVLHANGRQLAYVQR